VFGLTSDETGANLPADLAPRNRTGEGCAVETGPNMAGLAGGGYAEPVVSAFERGGVYVARSETISRRTSMPWCQLMAEPPIDTTYQIFQDRPI
jgi:hypothetical protein